ncbi:response regulator, partial [Haliscomenobacter sp.]|uniref:response regulator n=1 Tax=Haliscomenobacter sp. TaxID=2717303 RepID=UPI003365199A
PFFLFTSLPYSSLIILRFTPLVPTVLSISTIKCVNYVTFFKNYVTIFFIETTTFMQVRQLNSVVNFVKKYFTRISCCVKKQMNNPLNILLAEDDLDDQVFFEKALSELPISTKLTTVKDGEELMKYLSANSGNASSTDILFLDLSMPRKTGVECLVEIKENAEFKKLQVVMFTTSFSSNIHFEQNLINTLERIGADGFIRKSESFDQLKNTIETTLSRLVDKRIIQAQNK